MKLERTTCSTRGRGFRTALLGAAVTSSLIFVAACGAEEEPAPEQPQETAVETTTEVTTTETTTPTTSASESTTATSSSSARATGTRSNASDAEEDENVALARKKFGSLAPDSLFDAFRTCDPNGLQDSMACSGDKVGQFQFFESESKAASTTQLLTELRSARVVEDTGRKVVGWTTLGNTAIITVVDNDLGLVMQQMISSDEYEPRERIRELGLADSADTDSDGAEQADEASASTSASFNNADAEAV